MAYETLTEESSASATAHGGSHSPHTRSQLAPKTLESLVPAERRAVATILELVPEGTFLTYGIGVSLKEMTDPVIAQGHVPIM